MRAPERAHSSWNAHGRAKHKRRFRLATDHEGLFPRNALRTYSLEADLEPAGALGGGGLEDWRAWVRRAPRPEPGVRPAPAHRACVGLGFLSV